MLLLWAFLCSLLIATLSDATSLCNKAIDSVNASGIFTYHVDYTGGGGGPGNPWIPEPSWAITVNEQDGTPQTNLWYSTGGQNYSNDLALGYDVCAYYMSGLPLNTIELGQQDPGDCSRMFSPQCRSAILQRSEASASGLVGSYSPPPYSNLSAGSLPTICADIYAALGENGWPYPEECSQEFDYNPDVVNQVNSNVMTTPMALTGYNDSFLDLQCPLQVGEKTYNIVWEDLQTDPNTYDNATREVYPILTVYMPVANFNRMKVEGEAISKLTCARVKKFSEGSRVSPALPSGTPYTNGQGLSKGAIAGTAVGVVVFAALVLGLCVWLFFRRRRRQRQQFENQAVGKTLEVEAEAEAEADSTAIVELSPVDRKHEPDSVRDVAELGGGQGKLAELRG